MPTCGQRHHVIGKSTKRECNKLEPVSYMHSDNTMTEDLILDCLYTYIYIYIHIVGLHERRVPKPRCLSPAAGSQGSRIVEQQVPKPRFLRPTASSLDSFLRPAASSLDSKIAECQVPQPRSCN